MPPLTLVRDIPWVGSRTTATHSNSISAKANTNDSRKRSNNANIATKINFNGATTAVAVIQTSTHSARFTQAGPCEITHPRFAARVTIL